MRAIVRDVYGPPSVLRLEDTATPVPGDPEVLVRVHAAAVTSGDCKIRGFTGIPAAFWLPARFTFGVFRPRRRILGSAFSGVVEAVGATVTAYSPGDTVFGFTGLAFGAHAEFVCVPEDGVLAAKPANLCHDEAAAIPFGALTALSFLRTGRAGAGEEVLVVGAGGAVGAAAVQLARHFGATVTGVCSAGKRELVESLGATHVVDYAKEDFTESGERYDVVFDTVGATPFTRCKRVLKAGGRCLMAVFGLKELAQMAWTSVAGDKKIICAVTSERAEDLRFLATLIEAGDLRAVVGARYPLEQAADAHRLVETGHKTGSVVLIP